MKNSLKDIRSPFAVIAFVYVAIALITLASSGFDSALIWIILATTFGTLAVSTTDDNEDDEDDTDASKPAPDSDAVRPSDVK